MAASKAFPSATGTLARGIIISQKANTALAKSLAAIV